MNVTTTPDRDAVPDPSSMVVTTRLHDGHVRISDGWPDDVEASQAVMMSSSVAAAFLHEGPVAEGPVAVVDAFTDARSALLHRTDGVALLGAVAFGQWRHRVRFCPRCGASLHPDPGGRVLRCGAGHQEFPRIEPAVIMRVVDADDRILLARQPRWPVGRMSVLAGFVDPGETLEDTVRREVMEEVGVVVGDVDYVQSQPWPFPSSLMLAFHAAARTTVLQLQDDEIAEAQWFSRPQLQQAMDEGQVAIPPPLSVAHQLIRAWMGSPLAIWPAPALVPDA